MNKYRFIVLLAIMLSIGANGQKTPPNVVFFLVDDLGWKDNSFNGSKLYETPNIDKLANEAMYFRNAYAAYPRCVPSRFAMISGQHPAREGRKDGAALPLSTVTLAEALKAHGYGTFFAGKWHLGHEESEFPHHQGFDVNKGGCAAGAPGSYFFPYQDTRKSKNNVPYYGLEEGKEGEYITDRLTDEAVNYIKKNNPNKTGKPFLVYLSHYAVHTPLEAKADRVEYYEAKVKKLAFEGEPFVFGPDGKAKMWQDNAVYAAMVESMDESLGKIIAELKSLGIYNNTIIIFTSDHGGLSNTGLNNKRDLATTNKPLRAGKGHIYEGGIKVPVFVRWPGVVDKKSKTESIITGMDYYPSILEMCGFPLQPQDHMDGKSFVEALKGKSVNESRPFYWHETASRPDQTGDHACSAIRIGNYKLMHFLEDDKIELYDLLTDPYEQNNIANKNQELVTKMDQHLSNWKNEVGASEYKEKKNIKK